MDIFESLEEVAAILRLSNEKYLKSRSEVSFKPVPPGKLSGAYSPLAPAPRLPPSLLHRDQPGGHQFNVWEGQRFPCSSCVGRLMWAHCLDTLCKNFRPLFPASWQVRSPQ